MTPLTPDQARRLAAERTAAPLNGIVPAAFVAAFVVPAIADLAVS